MNEIINMDEYKDKNGYVNLDIRYCINLMNNLFLYKNKLLDCNKKADIRNIDRYIEKLDYVLNEITINPYPNQPKTFKKLITPKED